MVTIQEIPEAGSNEDTENEKKIEEIQPADETALMCLVDGKKYPSFTSRTSYGDTGASTHMRMSLDGMYDLEDIQDEIGGVGSAIKATRKGKFKGYILQADGTKTYRELDCVKYSAELEQDLFSITAELSAGARITSDENNNIELTYGDGTKIKFDRRVKTKDGWVAGVDIIPIQEQAKLAFSRSVDINTYHQELGHPCESVTKATAKLKNIRLTGEFRPCKDCAVGKSKQKMVSKAPQPKSKIKGEKLLMDISSPKTRSIGGRNHWTTVLR